MVSNAEKLRSLNCCSASYVRFSNSSTARVFIIWLNYKGQKSLYHTLLPGQFTDMNTYVTHPWVFENSDTGDWMAGNRKRIFLPESWESEYERLWEYCSDILKGRRVIPRKVIHITYPVYSLKERSLQVIRNCLSSEDSVEHLELPTTLKEELKVLIVKKNCLSNHSVPCNQCPHSYLKKGCLS